jgi:hypothetical protein
MERRSRRCQWLLAAGEIPQQREYPPKGQKPRAAQRYSSAGNPLPAPSNRLFC